MPSTSNERALTGPKGLSLDAKVDRDTVLFFRLLEHGDHYLWAVVYGKHNVLDAGLRGVSWIDLGDCAKQSTLTRA